MKKKIGFTLVKYAVLPLFLLMVILIGSIQTKADTVRFNSAKQIHQKGTTDELIIHFCPYVDLYLDEMQIRHLANDSKSDEQNVYKTTSWYMHKDTKSEYTVKVSSTDLQKWLPKSSGKAELKDGTTRTYQVKWDDKSEIGTNFTLYDDGELVNKCTMYNYILKYRTYISTDSQLNSLEGLAKWKNTTLKPNGKDVVCHETTFGAKNGYDIQDKVEISVPDSNKTQYIYVETYMTSGATAIKKTKVNPNIYNVSLSCGTGIKSVRGQGKYMVGDKVTVSAIEKDGYHFTKWTGTYEKTKKSFSFTMPAQNVALMANAEINSSTLKVDPNGGIWNGSNNVQSFKNNYRYQKNDITVPTRGGWKFVEWIKSNPFNGTMSSLTSNATYTYGPTNNAIDTITAKWRNITPPTSIIEPVKSSGSYATETYQNPNNGKLWFKDYLDAQIISQAANGSKITSNYLSEPNSTILSQSGDNPYGRHYVASQTDGNECIYLIGYAVDSDGNQGKIVRNWFYIDGKAPIIANLQADTQAQEEDEGVEVNIENGVLSVEMKGVNAQNEGEKWENVDVNVTVSVYDLQSGLMKVVLEKYDNGWKEINTINFNGEVDLRQASFKISSSGKYRIAVYDELSHVAYTNESEYWIDKIAPTITIAQQEYGWINEEVPLHFDIADNINGSGIEELVLKKISDDGSETEILVQKNISQNKISASVDAIISEEGITNYKLYARDKAGNQSYVYVTVKIDYVAPTADVDAVINEADDLLNVNINNVVEELSGCDLSTTYFEIKDTDQIVTDVLKYKFDSGRFSNIYTGAAFDYIGIDVMSKFDSCNSIDIDIHLFDIAGNERIYTKQVDIFDLQAELFRYLSIKDGNTGDYTKGENWRTGESGVIKITAGTHIERIEVIYPDEWIDKQTDDVTFPLNREKNIYTYVVPEIKTQENNEFMIPTGVHDENETYTIVVRAYKTRNGVEKMKEVQLPLIVNGSVLDDLRTRIRYHQ